MSGPCRWWLFPLLFPLGLTSSPYSAPLSQHCQATPGVARDDRAGAGVKDALWICQRRQWCRRCVLTDGHDATSRGWLGGLTSRLNVLTATPRGALALSLYSGPVRAPGGEAGKRSAPPSPPGALKDECSWAKKTRWRASGDAGAIRRVPCSGQCQCQCKCCGGRMRSRNGLGHGVHRKRRGRHSIHVALFAPSPHPAPPFHPFGLF